MSMSKSKVLRILKKINEMKYFLYEDIMEENKKVQQKKNLKEQCRNKF